MTEQEIRDQVSAILVEQFEIDANEIKPEAHLYDDLGIDSIDAVDLIVRLKELTGLRIPPEDFKDVRTVDDVVQVVTALTATS